MHDTWENERLSKRCQMGANESFFFTLTSIGHAEISKAEFFDVLFQSYALSTGVGLADKRLNRRKVLPRVGAGIPVIIESASRLSGKHTARYGPQLPECNQDDAQPD
jgi:hypothetical protein